MTMLATAMTCSNSINVKPARAPAPVRSTSLRLRPGIDPAFLISNIAIFPLSHLQRVYPGGNRRADPVVLARRPARVYLSLMCAITPAEKRLSATIFFRIFCTPLAPCREPVEQQQLRSGSRSALRTPCNRSFATNRNELGFPFYSGCRAPVTAHEILPRYADPSARRGATGFVVAGRRSVQGSQR